MGQSPSNSTASNLSVKYVSILIGWSVLVGISLAWNIHQELNETMSMAVAAARAHIHKDIVFRQWVASHGGVYVPPSATTPPNPYLMAPERDVVTTDGKTLTLLNPAYALRLLQDSTDKGSPLKSHITSLNPINPNNGPDAWEKDALERFQTGTKEVLAVHQSGGQAHLRLMTPFIVESDCLQCHGAQAYKLGDIRGGISVDVSMQSYQVSQRTRIANQMWSHGMIWLAGLLGVGGFSRRERFLNAKNKLAQDELFERDGLFRNYFELGRVGMCITSLDQKWLRVNQSLCEMLGYAAEELTHMTWTELTHPDDLTSDLAQFKRLIEGEIESYNLDKRFTHKSGKVVYTHLAVTCQRKIDGSVDYLIASVDDISERKIAEDAMRLSASVFTAAREGITLTDANGIIMDVNDSFTRITGYRIDEVLGKNSRLLQSGRHPKEFYVAMWRELLETGFWAGEIWNKRKNGEVYAEYINISSVRDEKGVVQQYVALFSDISKRKEMEERVRQFAFYDSLTELPNRHLLNDRLNLNMAASKRSAHYCALMFLDLDNFKTLNDQHGHEVGDLLLVEVAKRLSDCVREIDTVARFGGDEFVVLLGELDVKKDMATEQARVIAEKIRASLATPYLLNVPQGKGMTDSVVKHQCSASIGVVVFVNHEVSQSEVLRWADATMYEAKNSGRNSIRFYEAKHSE